VVASGLNTQNFVGCAEIAYSHLLFCCTDNGSLLIRREMIDPNTFFFDFTPPKNIIAIHCGIEHRRDS
jgi:hypothetical protein